MPLFFPTGKVRRVQELEPEWLRGLGIRGVLLDVDNTLSPHGAPDPAPEAMEWVRRMKNEGFRLILVSNNTRRRVEPFAGRIGLEFSAMACKPLPFGFRRALRKLDLTRRQAVVVGDQLFTDIVGANLAGIASVLVDPIEPETSLRFRVKRCLERPFVRRFLKKNTNRPV